MIPFFRKIRKKMADDNRPLKYTRYAIGEIVLVVIGILIALQINNWNEGRKQKIQLNNIYSIVHENLMTDLLNIEKTVDYYEKREFLIEEILTKEYSSSFLDSIDEFNYSECEPCKGQIAMFESFNQQINGFELLKDYNESSSLDTKRLSNEIIQFYSDTGSTLAVYLSFIRSEAYSNLKFYEEFPWYIDYMNKTYNPEAVQFFTQNQTYKNKAATYKNISISNFLEILRDYKEKASDFVILIEDQLAGKRKTN